MDLDASIDWFRRQLTRHVPAGPLVILAACLIGVLGGYGAVVFTLLIDGVSAISVELAQRYAETSIWGKVALAVPNGEATVRIKAGDAKILEKRLFAEDRSDTFDLEFSADQTIEIEVDDNNHPGNDWIYWSDLEVR